MHDQLGPQPDKLDRRELRERSSVTAYNQEPTVTALDVSQPLFVQFGQDTTVQLPTLRHSQTSNVI
ncbi:hypothetical protein [Bradyrhizobium sp. CCGB20]|uniref:hypothetical protein n=1 Tax=Bradyrhizobium sp. CCGB20 TaxID=2949633 RepID=UPI0020B1C6A1|nr:hypothetical protein [Bradyrhizobium sp. CCGB20]MCP3400391.1 hypothetical protein [Bradyrhizobium sp. CCGB20]